MTTHHDPLNEPWLLANSAGDPYDTPYRIVSEWEDGSYAHLEDKDISAILGSELKDHPILLVPKKYRQQLLDEALKDRPELMESGQARAIARQ